MGLSETEKEKYKKAWAHEAYHDFSPGVAMMPLFKDMVRPRRKSRLLDIGGGAGAASALLRKDGWDVTLMDHVDVAERRKRRIKFIEQNLWEPWGPDEWDVGYCCDVMEHIPPEKVDAVLKEIMAHCGRVFFSICFQQDHFGKVVGESLHLTVKPFEWWLKKLREHGEVRKARDLLGEGVFDVV